MKPAAADAMQQLEVILCGECPDSSEFEQGIRTPHPKVDHPTSTVFDLHAIHEKLEIYIFKETKEPGIYSLVCAVRDGTHQDKGIPRAEDGGLTPKNLQRNLTYSLHISNL